MDEKPSYSRAELVQRLQVLTQQASGDDKLQLPDLAAQLAALADQMRLACHTSAAGPASTSGPSGAAAAAAATAMNAAAAAAATAMDASNGDAAVGAADGTPPVGQPAKKQRRAPREFDFGRYRTRFVALELMYVGWAFQGFARQDNTENTIEGVLFSALRKVKLIPEASVTPISELNYSRCGRTDRGVSALGQVVALRLRSAARVDEPEAPLESEYDYPRLINKALPTEVRVLGWTPVPEDFNARFSAQYREYKYFIVQQRLSASPGAAASAPSAVAAAAISGSHCGAGTTAAPPGSGPAGNGGAAEASADTSAAAASATGAGTAGAPAEAAAVTSASGGQPGSGCGSGFGSSSESGAFSLDVEAMRAAAARFVGEHDFRNFCKPDVATVRSFRRRILSFTLDPVTTSAGEGARHQVYALTVRGTAFLWHQVRCMAAVLLMVGRGQERPSVVSELLDVEAHPCKPQYSMAPEEPLLLYACGFSALSFRRSPPAVESNLGDVAGLLHHHLIGAALTAACHSRLATDTRISSEGSASVAAVVAAAAAAANGAGAGGGGRGVMPHIPLMKRATEPSIEERMARRGIPWPPEPRAAAEGEAGSGAGAGPEPGEEDDPMVE